MESADRRFEDSVSTVNSHKSRFADVDDRTKLGLYGLYKCSTQKRGPLQSDNIHNIKFNAWKSSWETHKNVEDAMHAYADMVDILKIQLRVS